MLIFIFIVISTCIFLISLVYFRDQLPGSIRFMRMYCKERLYWMHLSVLSPKPVPERNSNLPEDYSVYQLSGTDKWLYTSISGIVIYGITYIFYNNALLSLLSFIPAAFVPNMQRKRLVIKRQQELTVQFRQWLYSMSSSLTAGRSVETSLRDALDDLRIFYADDNALMICEIEWMLRKLDNGLPIEKALLEFSHRARVMEISCFTDVFLTCKRTGGDLVEVIRRTSSIIGDKIEIQQEIAVMIAQKRLESKAISVIPFAIVAFLHFSSPDYLAPLYEGAGRVIMTAALAILLFSAWISKRMMEIRV